MLDLTPQELSDLTRAAADTVALANRWRAITNLAAGVQKIGNIAAVAKETQSRLDKAQAEHAALTAELAETRRTKADLETTFSGLRAAIAAAEGRLAELDRRHAEFAPIVEDASKAGSRLELAQAQLTHAERRLSELRQHLGAK
jgi:predicted  nucleic acid-binding Zn-ribbon protein